MDAESIKQLVAQMIEEQTKRSAQSEKCPLAGHASERELVLHKELEALRTEPALDKATGQSGVVIAQSRDTTQTPLSKMPLIADIEMFEPLPNLDDEDSAGRFDEWLKRFQFSLDCAAPNIDDRDKVKFLMTRLSKEAFSEYNKLCLPRDVTEFTYAETADRLRELFDPPRYSLYADRYECLRIVKENQESFPAYFRRVKSALRKFNFSELTEEQFSCLVALAGIRSPSDEAARTAILQRLNADGEKVRYDQVVGDCINLLKVREAADSSFQRFANRQIADGGWRSQDQRGRAGGRYRRRRNVKNE